MTYESLALSLRTEAVRLGEWLGVRLQTDAVETRTGELAHHMTSATAAASVGRWRREMGTDLCAMFERELGPELVRFGYG